MTDPFGQGPVPGQQPPEGHAYRDPSLPTCAACGVHMDPATASYSEQGEVICARCSTQETIDTGEQRAGQAIVGAAVGAFGTAIVSILCFNPFLIVSVLAVVAGIGSLVTMFRHPEYQQKVGGGKWTLAMVLSIFAILIGLIPVGLITLGMAAATVR